MISAVRPRAALRGAASFAALQLGWFACVLGAARGLLWLGPAVVALLLGLHVRAQPRGARTGEVVVLAGATILGFTLDTLLLRAGVIRVVDATVSPLWLVALWPNTAAATSPTGSLGFLSRHPVLAAALGAVCAPLAYDAGGRLGAIALAPDHLRALGVVGVAWLAVLPALFGARRLTAAAAQRV